MREFCTYGSAGEASGNRRLYPEVSQEKVIILWASPFFLTYFQKKDERNRSPGGCFVADLGFVPDWNPVFLGKTEIRSMAL